MITHVACGPIPMSQAILFVGRVLVPQIILGLWTIAIFLSLSSKRITVLTSSMRAVNLFVETPAQVYLVAVHKPVPIAFLVPRKREVVMFPIVG